MSSALRRLVSCQAVLFRYTVPARSFTSVWQHISCRWKVPQLKRDLRHLSQVCTSKQQEPLVNLAEDKASILLDMREAKDSEAFAKEYLDNLKDDDLDLLKLIQLEYYVMESEGYPLPAEDTMNNQRWMTLFSICPSRSSRAKQYRYWVKLDNAKAKGKAVRAERGKLDEERRQLISRKQDAGEIGYANRITMRIYERTMNEVYYNNLFHAMQFGIPIIYDFSFEDTMSFTEIKFTLDQSVMAYGSNKVHREPFHMVWTNVKPDSKLKKMLPKAIRDYEDKPFTVTEKSYLDLYPKEQLAWLSPNATEELKSYDPNTIYIVGGIVDTKGQPPMTFARAKKEGIRAYKLPVDRYLQWEKGSKNLTLDQVMRIMLEIKQSGNWKKALEHIPSRKIRYRLN